MNTENNKLTFSIIEGDIEKLERHRYAPEMNKVHLKNKKTISTPGCTTISQAINHIIIKNLWK